MRKNLFLISGLALFTGICWAQASVPLNTIPSRIVGHPMPETTTIASVSPNLVEGRELYSPEGIALDTSVTPPILYVSDAGNNRVLAWQNALSFTNGQKADLVIGQQDFYHTSPQGPGGTFQSGLNAPNGIFTDSSGNLYVVDAGNNRVLRYPRPFRQSAQTGSVFPDLWVGQPILGSSAANFGTGAVSDQGLSLAASAYPVNAALDAQGNLWVVDAGNSRVLRFAASDIAGGGGGMHANIEIGQLDFVSTSLPGPTANSPTVANAFATPIGIAFDASGNLFVTDFSASNKFGRVLVFQPPFQNKQSAVRIMGINSTSASAPQTVMGLPAGVFFIPANQTMGVLDAGSSRIMLFDSFDSGKWPDSSVSFSPQAKAVVGQPNFTNRQGNAGTSALYVPPPTASTLNFPAASVFNGNQLFVADTGNHRAIALPFSAGAFGAATGVLGQYTFAMSAPNLIEGREFNFFPAASGASADAGVAIDTGSDTPHLYVADPWNNRVLGFNDFRSLAAGATADIVIGQPDLRSGSCNVTGNPAAPTASSLCYPTGLAVDANGNLYVADTGNGRVLRFPAPFAHQGTLEQADLVLGQHQFTVSITDPTNSTMRAPFGLALAANNGLLVSDTAHHRVLFFPFTANGTFVAGTDNGKAATKVFGQQDFNSVTFGSGSAQLNSPHHISCDNEARLYVADSGNGRVMIFNQINSSVTPPTGATYGFAITGLQTPLSVFVNPVSSEIWVGDATSTVKKYPNYAKLPVNAASIANVQVPLAGLAVTQDQYGDLIVADRTNRVGFYFPAADAINGGNQLPSCVNGPAATCRALTPGVFAILCSPGSQCNPSTAQPIFGPNTAANTSLPNPYPMPTVLGDLQVNMSWTTSAGTINNTQAPLYYVSPTQINFVVPMGAPQSGLADIQVVQNSTGRIYAAGQVLMAAVSPAILMLEYTGNLRQAAVVNLADGTVNSTTNAAARGTYVSIYATGQGFVPNAPPDGAVVPGPVTAPAPVQVNINGAYLDQMTYDSTSDSVPKNQWLQYSGLSSYPGLWQINFYIPHAVVPGKQIPLIIVAAGEANTAPGTYLTYINVK